MDFTTRYKKLNHQQRTAVDTIEGPVMVVAGPGTGKTELLSVRVATILRTTDTLPENILLLTFTESGAHAMRERLATIIGPAAYKVAIHTFHSFGSEIINQYGEYFYQGAPFRPADELSTHEILRGIFDELDYTNPLASQMNGEYTYLGDTARTISELKRSGLTSDELITILDSNDALLDLIEPALAEIFSRRISATTLAQLIPITHMIAEADSPTPPGGVSSLQDVVSLSLAHAVDEATATDSTKPITAWKNRWLTKNGEGEYSFKDRARHLKLRAIADIYLRYLSLMQEAALYDYDDMILRVAHGMEVFDDLRFNLQERYHYIMVDEFQDTNLAQMRILTNLTNNPVQGDTPNILVVGDDDQAIYSFQGADISNIISFRNHYPKAVVIPLTDNYRSGETILASARTVITQGADRLEAYIDGLDKTLTSHVADAGKSTLYEAATQSEERAWIAASIAEKIKHGASPNTIAVLARRHHEIIALLPYFADVGVAVRYERRDNVFDLEPIKLLELLARVIVLLAEQQHDAANAHMPELLAHPAWGISSEDLWKLSITAYDTHTRWIDAMATLPAFSALRTWLIERVRTSMDMPLEPFLDQLLGTSPATSAETTSDEDFSPDPGAETVALSSQATSAIYQSPLYEFFFSHTALEKDPYRYISFLEALRTIRGALREHQLEATPTLATFLRFIDLYRETGSILTSVHQPKEHDTSAVHLMTVHKSKGLEFATVYLTGAVDSMWGERVRSKSRLISYPDNLPLGVAGDTPSERIRLFFVGMTRAKQHLLMSYALQNDAGKPQERASFLLPFEATTLTEHTSADAMLVQAKRRWFDGTLSTPSVSLRELLAPTLERYKLSATHLGNFLDVTRGGPQTFLLNNLLRFPQSMSPAAAYGSAIHETLQRAHSHLAATKKARAIEDLVADFEATLARYRLTADERDTYTQKGVDALQAFLAQHYDSFTPTQKVELNFAGQQSIVDGVHLTGKLDLVDLSPVDKTMIVTDYKTGHPSRSWQGKTEYEKIKLHRYRQQLLFYKLLVEHSRDYGSYCITKGVLQFVEPTKEGSIVALDEDLTHAELDEFRHLIHGVWKHITTLSLPSTDHYEPTLKGIQEFERDIIDGKS